MGIDDQNILIELVYNNMHGMGIGKIHGGDKLRSLEREKEGGGGRWKDCGRHLPHDFFSKTDH